MTRTTTLSGRRPAVVAAVLGLLATSACSDTVSGLTPVGGDAPTSAELERFSRRLHLDLTGQTAGETFLADAVSRLQLEGNGPATRLAMAEDLLAEQSFANTFVSELENRVFAGETLEGRYQFTCGIIRTATELPACNQCGPPPPGNNCGDCGCTQLTTLNSERTELLAAAERLRAGESTSPVVDSPA